MFCAFFILGALIATDYGSGDDREHVLRALVALDRLVRLRTLVAPALFYAKKGFFGLRYWIETNL